MNFYTGIISEFVLDEILLNILCYRDCYMFDNWHTVSMAIMKSASNNYYIVQNFNIITFQVYESFKQWPKDFRSFEQSETLTRLKTSNGVTRFRWLKKSRDYFRPYKFKEIKRLIKLFLPVILEDSVFPISPLPPLTY